MLAVDTETCLIEPGLLAPPLVCLTWATDITSELIPTDGDGPGKFIKKFFSQTYEGRQHIVGHNIAYDMAVLCSEYPELIPVIFEAYQEGRIHDTGIRHFLINVALGVHTKATKYSLKALALEHLGRELDKGEERVTFAQYRGKPLEDYSQDHVDYAISDAVVTYQVWEFQEAYYSELIRDEAAQCRAAFALHLCACWGMVTDQVAVDALESDVQKTLVELKDEMIAVGFMRPNGSMDMKAARDRMAAVNPDPKLTPTGAMALDNDACIQSGDELLIKRQLYTSTRAILNKDIPMFREPLITTRFGNAESGRTTSSKPGLAPGGNFQNLARRPGIRECIVPRPGMVFASADYGSAELHTLAQVCINMGLDSELAANLNAGKDVHLITGIGLLDISYEEAVANKGKPEIKRSRDMGKAANFGFSGGLGLATFIDFARAGYGVHMTEGEAGELKAAWMDAQPEMVEYFKIISRITDQPEPQIEHFGSRRLRGGVSYCQAANSFFQGMAADGAKAAVWEVQQACYSDPESILYGCRMVNFVHDEIILEVPDDAYAWRRADSLGFFMEGAFNHFTPDVPVSAEPLLMRRWSKNAEPTFDSTGRLVPWEPTNGHMF